MKTFNPTLPILSGIALAASGMVLSTAPPASAQLSWTWSYKCSILTTQTKCKGGSGTFTTTDQEGSGGGVYYLVTGMTGTVEGNEITSLLAPDFLGIGNDNKLSAPSGVPFLNFTPKSKVTGIAFLTNNASPTAANANSVYSLFIDDFVGYYYQFSGPNNLSLESVDWKSNQVGSVEVPEPSGFLGIVALGGLMLLGKTLRKASVKR